jgi:hypothetical protein
MGWKETADRQFGPGRGPALLSGRSAPGVTLPAAARRSIAPLFSVTFLWRDLANGYTFMTMNAQPSASDGQYFALPSSSIKVLMLYDDLATGHRVMRVFDSLLHHCGGEVGFHSDMWKFDTLRWPCIRTLATEDACNADVIIISGHGFSEFSEDLKLWMQAWTGLRSRQPGALVLLVDRAASYMHLPDPLQVFLEGIARQADMLFIPMIIEGEETDLPIRRATSGADEAPPSLEAFCRDTARLSSSPARPVLEPVAAAELGEGAAGSRGSPFGEISRKAPLSADRVATPLA